jgi:hypothetical protein
MTPNFAVVHVEHPRWRGIHLWLPIFLLWIPFILVLPPILLVLFVVCLVGRVSFWGALSTFWNLFCGLRGTDVRVCADGKRITVRIM